MSNILIESAVYMANETRKKIKLIEGEEEGGRLKEGEERGKEFKNNNSVKNLKIVFYFARTSRMYTNREFIMSGEIQLIFTERNSDKSI